MTFFLVVNRTIGLASNDPFLTQFNTSMVVDQVRALCIMMQFMIIFLKVSRATMARSKTHHQNPYKYTHSIHANEFRVLSFCL